ncbi:cytochrome b6-f complex iron-sulfur subunit [Malonomonas rubra DSM 5091]|uniref:Cytochrome b6-f complex iron-sulfur subunit n=1 Tax=Malonomonas rubra DSM 5091 TaxID=1122189 RepID=A0A1M6LZ29_MALRU|nr:Rieske (2Fe-2S) protein [Malonomonas rubra]SHJ76474.1 cytochrome b6-f complex iron-sulfur subunit [Malonomonas rubra DSM 5091]
MDDATPKERRTFLTVILGGVGAVVAAVAGWPLFRYLSPIDKGSAEDLVRVARQEVAVGGAHFFSYQGRPAVLLQPSAGEFLALSAVCTHLGCIVKWVDDKQEFLCPCHGGRFSPAGQVLGGPPPTALESYPVSLDGEDILVG